jgi:DNA polymerase III epsilon subunit-like protein
MVKICVFDTETTDVPPPITGQNWDEKTKKEALLLDYNDLNKTKSIWVEFLSQWPSIIQLSYIIYDIENPEESKIYNKYIDIPDDVIISNNSFAIHHINKEFIDNLPSEKKVTIEIALSEFMHDIMNPDVKYVVGHNVQFDRKMIIAELLKLKNKLTKIGELPDMVSYLEFMMDTNKNKFACTMEETILICNILREIKYKDKKTGEDKVFFKPKSPKLIESYFHYFGYYPNGEALHDAIIDVILCLRVFMKYKYDIDVCGLNNIITDYIIKISPDGYVCPIDITEKMNEQITETLSNDVGLNLKEIVVDFNESNKKIGGQVGTKRRKKGKKSRKSTKSKKRGK